MSRACAHCRCTSQAMRERQTHYTCNFYFLYSDNHKKSIIIYNLYLTCSSRLEIGCECIPVGERPDRYS